MSRKPGNTGDISWTLRNGLGRQILEELLEKDVMTTSELSETLQTTDSTISNYLNLLKKHGYVEKGKKDGRKQYYTFNKKANIYFEREKMLENQIQNLKEEINEKTEKLNNLGDNLSGS